MSKEVKKPKGLVEAEKEVVNEIAVRRLKAEERLDDLYKVLDEGDYLKQSYSADSKVEISGVLFSSMVNFIQSNRRNLYAVQNVINVLNSTVDNMLLDASSMTVNLMEAHKDNVDAGKTISATDLDKEDAKENIKPIVSKKKKKKA